MADDDNVKKETTEKAEGTEPLVASYEKYIGHFFFLQCQCYIIHNIL